MRFITVSEAIKKLAVLDADAILVVPSNDHSYREVYSISETKAQITFEQITEFDESFGIDDPTSKVIKVVTIE